MATAGLRHAPSASAPSAAPAAPHRGSRSIHEELLPHVNRTGPASSAPPFFAKPPSVTARRIKLLTASKPKWINPCGINPTGSANVHHVPHVKKYYDVTPLSDRQLYHNIILAAKNALKHTRFFKDEYVSESNE